MIMQREEKPFVERPRAAKCLFSLGPRDESFAARSQFLRHRPLSKPLLEGCCASIKEAWPRGRALHQTGGFLPTLEDAIALAVAAHQGQRDKSGQPYILHPLRVMFRLDTDEERMTAVLHDVLEDTPHTAEELRGLGYPARVVDALERLSRRESESYEEFIERLAPDSLALRVKLADLEDNMDVRRLEKVGPKEAERLARYLKAHRYLSSRKLG
jgi:(p)ppGpp synthase/HD superfamily hydrolase